MQPRPKPKSKPRAIIPPPPPKRNPPKPSTNGTSILTEALRLHDLGYWVVVCEGKKAISKAWQSRRQSRAELEAALKGTHRNIALVLNRSELIDVECDSDEAENALQAMFGGKIPKTPIWQSKRGRHRLFRRPADLPDKAVVKLNGVEFRGTFPDKGAYSLIPPSVHPDGPAYQWLPGRSIHDVEPAELPGPIVERLRTASDSDLETDPTAEGDITEGERNDFLFKFGCKLARNKCGVEEIVAALLMYNKRHCKPPLETDEVIATAKSAAERGKKGGTIADRALELATKDAEYWHTPDKTAFTSIRCDNHTEHYRVRSRAYKQWIAGQFYKEEGGAIGSQTMDDVLGILEARAVFDGEEHPVFVRIAGHEGKIYIDLADDTWRAIEIDAEGWNVVSVPPVRFRRAKGMLPLPAPERDGRVGDLRSFVNVTDDDWPLLLAWLVAAFRPSGPYALLKLLGEQGSAKTTTAEVLRKLIDPNAALLRRPPSSERDLMIAASNGWIVGFDNLSYVKTDLSDALCSLATGGGFATRTLYSDDDETILVAERPILLNGIEDIGTRSDLLDRSVIVELPRIESDKRKAEDDFWREFDEARPRIIGALLDAVAVALRELPTVKRRGGQWPRMKDFAEWATAAEPALGLELGAFLIAYERSRDTANQTALESSPVVKAIWGRLKVRNGRLEGTATELLNELSFCQDTKVKGWPKAPRVLSGILSRLAPNLRGAGLTVEQGWRGKDKTWRIAYTADAPVQPSQPTQKSGPNLKPSPKPGSRGQGGTESPVAKFFREAQEKEAKRAEESNGKA